MRITEKTTNRRGQEIRVVEMIPERVEGTWRSKFGLAGVLLLGGAITLAFGIPEMGMVLRFKMIFFGVILGALLLAMALGRSVFRASNRVDVRKGYRILGLTMWETRLPLTNDLVLDISRTEASEIFVSVRRSESTEILSIGPFIDGDQAVEACRNLRPRQIEVDEKFTQNPARVIHDLEGAVPTGVSQFVMISLFFATLIPAWWDRSVLDVTFSILLGILVLLVAVRWFAPRAGVFRNTDTGESVEFWIRNRPFNRLEYRKALGTPEPPVFLRRKFHWATVLWLLMIPLQITAVVIFYRMSLN